MGTKTPVTIKRHGQVSGRRYANGHVQDEVLFFVRKKEGTNFKTERKGMDGLVGDAEDYSERHYVGQRARNDGFIVEVTGINGLDLGVEAFIVPVKGDLDAKVDSFVKNVHGSLMIRKGNLVLPDVNVQTVLQGQNFRVPDCGGQTNSVGLNFQGTFIV